MPLFLLSLLQSLLLVTGQVCLKLALMPLPPFQWSLPYFAALVRNVPLAACGVCYGVATLLWMYIVKHFPFSMAYPLVSMSYALGMVAAVVVFHETVSPLKWAGVLLIMAGCYCIAK